MEIWKEIPGYEDLYMASNLGRIKSLQERGGKKPGILFPSKRREYISIRLTKDKVRKTYGVHRLIAATFLGFDLSTKMKDGVVMHLDNDPKNNNVDNLKVGTQSENMRQCINENRGPQFIRKGESHPRTKFTEKDILYIRKQRELGVSGVFLGKMFGVTRTTICDIYKRKVWRHV